MHSHTMRCGHAFGTDREYVEAAIEAGYEVLGFSDHSPMWFEPGRVPEVRMPLSMLEDYVCSVSNLRDEYKDDIEIHLGLELEYLPVRFDRTIEELRKFPIEYMLLGQHFFEDECRESYVASGSWDEEHLDTYASLVIRGLDTGLFMYVAHPDLCIFKGSEDVFWEHMKPVSDALRIRDIPFELNVGGYSRNLHYPRKEFVRRCVENGNKFIIGIDSHMPSILKDTSLAWTLYDEYHDIIPDDLYEFRIPGRRV